MLNKIEIFNMAQAMAEHAATRQSAVAQNIANADTPGYQSRDVASFSDTYKTQTDGGLTATRTGHILPGEETITAKIRIDPTPGTESPNGNTVSLEHEMLNATDVKRQHDMALTIYSSSLKILRTTLGQ
ncbi:FlgB family protein [Halocynthiibacter namhaensis]|uniref:FlgB family protein n=1 Tax=Halocynthiibacter namhaensis TaxID=1290553 RepID=UPI00057916FB|nr:FlgB family protein [Halocynthiibacter namhaensis]